MHMSEALYVDSWQQFFFIGKSPGPLKRERDDEGASFSGSRFHGKLSVMGFYDPFGDRKSETGTVAFGSVKRLKNVRQSLRSDAASVITDLNLNPIVFPVGIQ